jgi:uncharacterized Ntn-hydrolase superfamily protein
MIDIKNVDISFEKFVKKQQQKRKSKKKRISKVNHSMDITAFKGRELYSHHHRVDGDMANIRGSPIDQTL